VKKTYPDGREAIPLDQKDGAAVHSSLDSNALKKNDN